MRNNVHVICSLLHFVVKLALQNIAFSALTLLVERQEWHLACKKWGMVEVGTGWSTWSGT